MKPHPIEYLFRGDEGGEAIREEGVVGEEEWGPLSPFLIEGRSGGEVILSETESGDIHQGD